MPQKLWMSSVASVIEVKGAVLEYRVNRPGDPGRVACSRTWFRSGRSFPDACAGPRRRRGASRPCLRPPRRHPLAAAPPRDGGATPRGRPARASLFCSLRREHYTGEQARERLRVRLRPERGWSAEGARRPRRGCRRRVRGRGAVLPRPGPGRASSACLDTERAWVAFPRRGAVSGKLAGVRKEAGMNSMKVMVMWKTGIAR